MLKLIDVKKFQSYIELFNAECSCSCIVYLSMDIVMIGWSFGADIKIGECCA